MNEKIIDSLIDTLEIDFETHNGNQKEYFITGSQTLIKGILEQTKIQAIEFYNWLSGPKCLFINICGDDWKGTLSGQIKTTEELYDMFVEYQTKQDEINLKSDSSSDRTE